MDTGCVWVTCMVMLAAEQTGKQTELVSHREVNPVIQQIVTLSKYGHDALDICHP